MIYKTLAKLRSTNATITVATKYLRILSDEIGEPINAIRILESEVINNQAFIKHVEEELNKESK